MFLHFFIAILLGLATPANTNNNCNHNGGTTVTTAGDTGGDNGHLPPPKIGD
ncbi:hypothetical protein [Pedobacter alluvionis]|uniref:Uncharacterized protein n=1 Tax=Pedobacter alluvionis TaxID=475253 RepID=A0A497XXS7_9SPHI|nr:hypothetical protein [Pedobacter alluvionis]RLJ73709.1 hypothetical protein BCL90_3873 [Pedobacter alluvionis]